MQTKKDEIREKILAVAEIEFLKRGFKNASMRTIAAKSHTTLGNLYNYFDNKEAILDEVLGNTPEKVFQILRDHERTDLPINITKEELEENFNELIQNEFSDLFPLDILLSNALLILMEGCEDTKYEAYRNTFLDLFQNHIATHLNVEADSFLAKSLAHGFISSLLFIGKNKSSFESGRRDLIQYIKAMTLGMPINKK